MRKTCTSCIGMFGHLARMVVFGLDRRFLIKAAVDYNPNKAIGLDGALAKVANHSYGALAARHRRGRPDRVRSLLAGRRSLPPHLSRAVVRRQLYEGRAFRFAAACAHELRSRTTPIPTRIQPAT